MMFTHGKPVGQFSALFTTSGGGSCTKVGGGAI